MELTSLNGEIVTNEFHVQSGHILNIECTAFGGNPSPSILWILGGDNVAESYITTREENTVRVSSLQLPIEKEHNKMILQCVVEHERLESSMIKETQLNVGCELLGILQLVRNIVICYLR